MTFAKMFMRPLLPYILALVLIGTALAARPIVYHDDGRSRDVPVDLFVPDQITDTSYLVFLCPGNAVPGSRYCFLVKSLVANNAMVAVIQYQLPNDLPLPMAGNLYELRKPSWGEAVRSILFVRERLTTDYPQIARSRVVLLGHSNGGDIVTLCATLFPEVFSGVVAMDNRRMPVPRTKCPRFLSLRGVEYKADPGVLPEPKDHCSIPLTIETIESAKHMDFTDDGPPEIRAKIVASLLRFLGNMDPAARP
jgi:dienelactone hydrolase